ncbi:MAG: DNA mismatch repair endonuclease MutL [Polyangiaceae bacterium]|nr:DNA mismatch repair endonuclease MutL [Polyangiaceae bacterium]
MASIAVLPPDLASQIAAGEVVERPASAAKELVENSLDAGARRCDIAIEGGGVTGLRVTDDGAGMAEADARLAVERHATSKLRVFDDLRHVASFGFRGEALPSIASVCRFTLRTRMAEEDAGIELTIEGGGLPEVRPAGTAVGTEVSLRDLFFNVPARRKFLRSTGTEAGHVVEAIESLALARPDVTFTIERDGRRVREWLRAAGRAERVRDVIGDVPLIPCEGTRGPLRVEAFLSRPEQARTGAGGLRLLVNARVVRDRAVAATVAQAYGSVLERGRYPRGVVYLDIAPELVDVNVHPQKAEVRFADPRAITDALYSLLSRELAAALSLPRPNRSAWGTRGSADPPKPRAAGGSEDTDPRTTAADLAYADTTASGNPEDTPAATGHEGLQGEARDPLPTAADDPWGLFTTPRGVAAPCSTERGAEELREPTAVLAVQDSTAAPLRPRPEVEWQTLRFLAQVQKTYLVCEGKDGIYVIDQHAAAERVNFHRLRKAYAERSVAAQSLLFPLVIDAPATEVALVEEHGSAISAVGFDLRVRGPQSLSIHAVPRLLQRASPERLVRDLIGELLRTGGRGFSDAIDLALARMACHGAVRAGDGLSSTEASALLAALDGADFAGFCPHGRPVVAFTSWGELERKVGRR